MQKQVLIANVIVGVMYVTWQITETSTQETHVLRYDSVCGHIKNQKCM